MSALTDSECRAELFRLIGFLEFTVPNLRTSLRETALRALERKVETFKRFGSGDKPVTPTAQLFQAAIRRRHRELGLCE